MRTNIAFGWTVLGLAATLALGSLAFLLTYHAPPPPGPLVTFAPCRPIVGGATPVYVCQGSGHAYAVQHGKTVDLGPVTPAPWRPAY